jgi:hypothetical protein
MTDWVVGIEQTKPYEWVQLEIFSEENDALAFAEAYASRCVCHKVTRRTWKIVSDDASQRLIVRKA